MNRRFWTEARFLALIVCAFVVTAACILVWTRYVNPQHPAATHATPVAGPPLRTPRFKDTYPLLSQPSSGARLFGACPTKYVVLSAYGYEANLLNYSTPVADIDYIHDYAAQCIVTLPGTALQHYAYLGAVLVQGSGWVSKWATPNGGHFALLHLGALYTQTFGMPRFNLPPNFTVAKPLPGHAVDGDNETARVIGNVVTIPQGFQTLIWPGGAAIGVSRWPDLAIYGNGSYGPVDAHLCFLLDAKAAAFFYHYLVTPHPARPSFALKAWQKWCKSEKGRRCVSPWANAKHTVLTWPASWFQAHPKARAVLGGKTTTDHWVPPAKGRAYGWDDYGFGRKSLLCWPHYHACKVA